VTAPGAEKIARLREGGFSEQAIADWEQQTRAKLESGGFAPATIDEYFGRGPVQFAKTDARLSAMMAPEEGSTAEVEPVKGLVDALVSGGQGSISGLTARGRLPDRGITDQNSIWEGIAFAVGQSVGDLPVSIPAFFAGAVPGTGAGGAAGATVGATGGPVGAGVGAAAGAVIGGGVVGGAASGFVTEGTRAALVEFLRENEDQEVTNLDFVVGVASKALTEKVLKEAGKGALFGAATGVAGGAGRVAAAPIKSAAAREIAVGAAEMGGLVAAMSAIEGELPTKKDFAVAAGAFLAFKSGDIVAQSRTKTHQEVQRRLEDHYVKTGLPPRAAVERMERDPVFKQEILAGDNELPPKPILREADGEPLVFNAERLGDEGEKAVRDASSPHEAIVAAARAEIRGRIKSTDQKAPPISAVIDDLRYRYINDLQYMVSEANRAYKDATGKKLSIEENPGELARLAFGSHAKTELALREGIFSPDGKKKLIDGFETILGRLPKEDLRKFEEYAVSKRVMEKQEQGVETGFDMLEADVLVKEGDANPKFTKAFKEIQDWQNSMVRELLDTGLLDADGAASLLEANKSYVPFARVMDESKAPPGVSTRGLPVRRATKAFTGSEREIFSPLEIMVKNRYALQQIADNNRARQELVKFNETLPDEFKILSPAKKKIRPVELAETDTNLKRFLEENGLEADALNGVTIYRAASQRLDKNQFIVFEEGKAVVYEAKNADLVRSLQSLDRNQLDLVSKILAVPSSLFRTGTTASLDFILKSTVRDQLSSVLVNSFKVLPVYDAIVGLKGILGKSDAYIRWIQSGGANSALLDLDRRILKGALSHQDSTASKAWNAATTPYRLLAYASTIMENSMRVGQFVRAEKSAGRKVAALRSRDVGLDFARMGANVRAWNMISAWLGASINGLDRAAAAFKNDPVGTATKTAAFITAPSLLLWWANKDEKWYKELPDWEKALFWHFDTGAADDRGFPVIVRVPMPQQFGTLFGYAPTAILDAYVTENPDVMQDISESVTRSLSLDLMPVLFSPLIEIGTNTNFYSGAPLVSRALEQELPEYRYTPYTTELAKTLSKSVAFPGGIVPERFRTPIAIEHLVRNWSGTLGEQTLRLLDAGLRKAGVLPDITRPDPTFPDLPFVGGFFTRVPNASKTLEDFYRYVDEIEQVKSSMESLEEQERYAEVDRIERQYGMIGMKTDNSVKAIGRLRKAIYGIHYDTQMTADEKRQLIDDYTLEMIEIADAFNEEYLIAKADERKAR